MTHHETLLIILLAPLAGAIINGLHGKRAPKIVAGILATACCFISFATALYTLIDLRAAENEAVYYNWIQSSQTTFGVQFSLLFDKLTAIMVLVVTGVGSLIHFYSIGYMREDETPHRFFAYLNLFIFSMLILVMGSSLPLVFVGWEGVGLCSYLLIGYWYKEIYRSNAAIKAFVVNRIGDFGFILGMLLLYGLTNTLEFKSLEVVTHGWDKDAFMIPCLLLFLGATGKSAQIPLYTWLPDAMAGPTPVSALIHAATMVTAGVYLFCRISFLVPPQVLEIILFIGLATAFIAALMGTRENNIKKVLAYSTISQLGYMFCAVGAGAFGAAMFHLVTHAFFKALLFLGAGVVIHFMHGEEDMRKMGGLRHNLKGPFWCIAIAAACLGGMLPLSGFWSKEEIISALWIHHKPAAAVLLLTSCITTFYIFRMVFMTFFGATHAHEGHTDFRMNTTLYILAGLSVLGGIFGVMVTGAVEGVEGHAPGLMIASLLVFIIGLGTAGFVYAGKRKDEIKQRLLKNEFIAKLDDIVSNKFYVDKIYDMLVVLPLQMGAFAAWLISDTKIIEGVFVNGIPALFYRGSEYPKKVHTGSVNWSTGVLAAGMVVMIYFLMRRIS